MPLSCFLIYLCVLVTQCLAQNVETPSCACGDTLSLLGARLEDKLAEMDRKLEETQQNHQREIEIWTNRYKQDITEVRHRQDVLETAHAEDIAKIRGEHNEAMSVLTQKMAEKDEQYRMEIANLLSAINLQEVGRTETPVPGAEVLTKLDPEGVATEPDDSTPPRQQDSKNRPRIQTDRGRGIQRHAPHRKPRLLQETTPTPKPLNKPPAFFANLIHHAEHLGEGQTIRFDGIQLNIGNSQTIRFDGVQLNIGNAYNPSTGIFTAPTGGLYVFSWNIMVHPQHYQYTGLMVSGSRYANSFCASTPHDQTDTNVVTVELSRGSSVWIETYDTNSDHVGSVHGNTHSKFSGWRVAEYEI